MPSIHTLVQDIYDLVQNKRGKVFSPEAAAGMGEECARRIVAQFHDQQSRGKLRLSGMGPKCPCQLWYSIHHPEMAEQLPPWATIKYTYGHILEAMAIGFAKAAGHEVTGEQDELVVDGIKGHRDCVIDGCIVDVKSSSSRGFIKFKDRTLAQDDSFGYLDQLDGYLVGSAGDPLVRIKDKAYILAIDKQLGHMCIYEHHLREDNIKQRIADYKSIVRLDRPPSCTCEEIPDGKSGNYRLGTKASYSAFKFACKPYIRTFLYANGPVYLTKVERKPDVPEVDRYGKYIYN